MPAVTPDQLAQQIRRLPPDKLAVVADFVAFLEQRAELSDEDFAMKASEDALRRLWDTPEEDEAWSHL